jgi:hypothetical protein
MRKEEMRINDISRPDPILARPDPMLDNEVFQSDIA